MPGSVVSVFQEQSGGDGICIRSLHIQQRGRRNMDMLFSPFFQVALEDPFRHVASVDVRCADDQDIHNRSSLSLPEPAIGQVPHTALHESIFPAGLHSFSASNKMKRVAVRIVSATPIVCLEAATGFEPVNNGFADRCLSHLAMPPFFSGAGERI